MELKNNNQTIMHIVVRQMAKLLKKNISYSKTEDSMTNTGATPSICTFGHLYFDQVSFSSQKFFSVIGPRIHIMFKRKENHSNISYRPYVLSNIYNSNSISQIIDSKKHETSSTIWLDEFCLKQQGYQPFGRTPMGRPKPKLIFIVLSR